MSSNRDKKQHTVAPLSSTEYNQALGPQFSQVTQVSGREFTQIPTIIQQKPEVVHQVIQEVEREVVQPVLRRDVEKTEIHQVTQPLHQREIKATLVEQATLPVENRPTIVEQGRLLVETPVEPSTTFIGVQREVVEQPPIIQESVHKQVIEEVQPILHKETIQPHLVNVVKPIHEKIVEAPVYVTEVLPTKELPTQTYAQPILGQGQVTMNLPGQGFSGQLPPRTQ